MRDKYFNRKLLNLALILLLLVGYQTVLYTRAQDEEIDQLQYQIDASGAQAQTDEAASGGSGGYKDGTYTGEAQGFGGAIDVSVTVEGGQITAIDIVSADGEDSAYLETAKSVIDTMIDEQSTNVDTVSGATFSSGGIRDAVEAALEGAAE